MKVSKNSPEFLKGQIRKASRMYEEQFLRQMVKAMRGTVTHSKMTKPSMGEKIYMEQLDQEYVKSWSEKEGAGLADMIYQDIIEKYYPQLADKKPQKLKPTEKSLGKSQEKIIDKPTLPVEKSNEVKKVKGASPVKSANTFLFEGLEQGSKLSLKSPWPGKLDSIRRTGREGEFEVSLSHANGMNSKFSFFSATPPKPLVSNPEQGQEFLEILGSPKYVEWVLQKEKA